MRERERRGEKRERRGREGETHVCVSEPRKGGVWGVLISVPD